MRKLLMTTTVSLRAGHDVGYFNAGHGAGGCAGAMAYYTKSGEPPGQWAGRGAAKLGLSGQVDPDVIQNLYMRNIRPGREVLARQPKQDDGTADIAVARAVHAYKKQHPYASAIELDEVRARARAKQGAKSVPYFDETISMVKSASALHASYRVGAMLERAAGRAQQAAVLDARADAIEGALMDAARDAVRWLERHATYTRTGYHSAVTGEWRDAAGGTKDRGLTAALFLHHLSRDGDPHLHVHMAIWNRVQRADGADDKYRTLFGRALFRNKLGLAPVPDRFAEKRLRDLGYVMVPRADGNGCEVGGVSEKVMARFSSRAAAIGPELAKLAGQWKAAHGGKEPSARTLWLLHQQAGQKTRRTKAQARRTVAGRVGATEPTDEERLAAWEKQTAADEMQALSLVWQYAEKYARDHAPAGAPGATIGAAAQPAVLRCCRRRSCR
jgi:TrwC relaxase